MVVFRPTVNRFTGLSQCRSLDGRLDVEVRKNLWVGSKVSNISMNHYLSADKVYLNQDTEKIAQGHLIDGHAITLPWMYPGEHIVESGGAIEAKSFVDRNQIIRENFTRFVKKFEEYS